MRRYSVVVLAIAVFAPASTCFALTCTPPSIKICNGSNCYCSPKVNMLIRPDGALEFEVQPDQAGQVLKQLKIDPKSLKSSPF